MSEQEARQSFEQFKQWAEQQDPEAAARAGDAQQDAQNATLMRESAGRITPYERAKFYDRPEYLDNEIDSQKGRVVLNERDKRNDAFTEADEYRLQALKFLRNRVELDRSRQLRKR